MNPAAILMQDEEITALADSLIEIHTSVVKHAGSLTRRFRVTRENEHDLWSIGIGHPLKRNLPNSCDPMHGRWELSSSG